MPRPEKKHSRKRPREGHPQRAQAQRDFDEAKRRARPGKTDPLSLPAIALAEDLNRHSGPEDYNMHSPGVYADANLMRDLEQLDLLWNPPPNPYATNPVGWVHDIANIETWSKQNEIYNAVNEHRYVSVKSCHGPGKSFTAAHVVGWWLSTRVDPFVVTSAPTSHQVKTILWREIKRAQKRAKLPGHITNGQVPEWKINDELVAFGRKPADYLDANEASAAFQGIHALNTLIVLDEGSGIPDWLANACETLITNEQSRLLIIGNPDNPVSYFAKTFKPGSDFYNIQITAFDTPAFTGEVVSKDLADRLTSKIWVEERKKRWGEGSPMYKAKVLAEFPEMTDDTVFTPAIIARAIAVDRSGQAKSPKVKKRYGFDVARLGPDESVVYENRSGYIRLIARWSKVDTMEGVGRYRRATQDEPELASPGVVDATGLGAGVFDRLRELGYPVIPFNGGEKAYNPLKYKNRRSESYWEARELMDEGMVDIEELDEDLQAELLEVRFKLTSTGQIQLENKEDIAARLGRSPDRADAFVMSMQQAAGILQEDHNSNQMPGTQTDLAAEPQHHQDGSESLKRPSAQRTGTAVAPGEADGWDGSDPSSDVMNLEF